jgi:hypothetical protein
MMEEVFRRHANEGLGKRAVDLPPQRVKVLGWRGAIDDAHVVRSLRVPPHPPCLPPTPVCPSMSRTIFQHRAEGPRMTPLTSMQDMGHTHTL